MNQLNQLQVTLTLLYTILAFLSAKGLTCVISSMESSALAVLGKSIYCNKEVFFLERKMADIIDTSEACTVCLSPFFHMAVTATGFGLYQVLLFIT